MAELRRIEDGEGALVAALWDEQAREGPDGAPLTEWGRRNIARMLDIAGWHERQTCIVAAADGLIVGFSCAHIDPGTGLLPGLVGEIDALYVTPRSREQGLSRALAEAVVAELRSRGARTIRNLICAEDEEALSFWLDQGFERDMVCLSLYPPAGGRQVTRR